MLIINLLFEQFKPLIYQASPLINFVILFSIAFLVPIFSFFDLNKQKFRNDNQIKTTKNHLRKIENNTNFTQLEKEILRMNLSNNIANFKNENVKNLTNLIRRALFISYFYSSQLVNIYGIPFFSDKYNDLINPLAMFNPIYIQNNFDYISSNLLTITILFGIIKYFVDSFYDGDK